MRQCGRLTPSATPATLFFMRSQYVLKILCLATVTSLSAILSAADSPDTLEIGVLLPDLGPSYSLGEQIRVGVEIGIQRLASTRDIQALPVFVYADLSDEYSVRAAYSQLQDQRVDAVIGAATPTEATHLRAVAAGTKEPYVPTVLLSHARISDNAATPLEHILQLGLPPEEVYQLALSHYLKANDVKKLSVIYDPNYTLAAYYGSQFTEEALSSLPSPPDANQIPSQSAWATGYDREVKQVSRYQPDLTVVSAATWDTSNLVAELSGTLETTPIFIAPPVEASNQMRDFAARSSVPIYHGAQFWPDMQDQTTKSFMDEAFNRLGWSATASPSRIAIEAHDAVQVVATAWENWRLLESISSPWDAVDHVPGLTGELTQRDGYTMAGPLSLVTIVPPAENSDAVFSIENIGDE